MTFHQFVLVAVSVLLAMLASGRASWVLGEKWGLSERKGDNPSARDVMTTFAAVIAGILAGFGANAAFESGGVQFGLIAALTMTPIIGAIWVIIVGGNKVAERLLNGIDSKLSTKN